MSHQSKYNREETAKIKHLGFFGRVEALQERIMKAKAENDKVIAARKAAKGGGNK